jgi:hypothetical protein
LKFDPFISPQPPLKFSTKFTKGKTWIALAKTKYNTWVKNSKSFVRNTIKENTHKFLQLKYQPYFVSNYQNRLRRESKFTYKSAPIQKIQNYNS